MTTEIDKLKIFTLNARLQAIECVFLSMFPEKKEELSAIFMAEMDKAIAQVKGEITD
jgi:hypothetical protein